METSSQNGVRTDHDRDRDQRANGINGTAGENHQAMAKAKGAALDSIEALANGGHDVDGDIDKSRTKPSPAPAEPSGKRPRMNDLPDEIIHITQGFIPLSSLITRLVQQTHNKLEDTIMQMARMPLPSLALNGNAAHGGSTVDDSSPENLAKKLKLLNFAHEMHTKWVKALVITDWSRSAEDVSKLIDIKYHLDQQRMAYDNVIGYMGSISNDLQHARLWNPDLKTALQVLSTGGGSWMPHFNYIVPPPLTAEEQLKWLEDLNTLLDIRLNLEDFDKVPYHFQNYTIESGRVTFKVQGEFEVDLTIAKEDDEQFWFIDFRFAFSPSASEVSEALREYLGAHVNDALLKDGLLGCYRFLHEFVLTHKINELKRQAIELNRGTWTNSLVVEPLNRALAIQYWNGRYPPAAPKSWIMIAVNSGRRPNGAVTPQTTSHLTVRWYRDGKEMKDVELPFDTETLSIETLLKTAIARHVEHILSTIHSKLLIAPRFVKRESAMALKISRTEPIESTLIMQLGCYEEVKLIIEPVTGFFALQPHTRYSMQGENRLNLGGKDPAEDGVSCLESIRRAYLHEEVNRRGKCLGWTIVNSPLPAEDVKQMFRSGESFYPVFFHRKGWRSDWFLMMTLSLSGDEWWLFEVDRKESTSRLKNYTKLPLNLGLPDMTERFWNNLTLFAAGMMTHLIDLGELHRRKIKTAPRERHDYSLPREVRMPSVFIRLSDILPSLRPLEGAKKREGDGNGNDTPNDGPKDGAKDAAPSGTAEKNVAGAFNEDSAKEVPVKRPWAEDFIELRYKGLQVMPSDAAGSEGGAAPDGSTSPPTLSYVEDAILKVNEKEKFRHLSTTLEKDVFFCPRRGQFSFRIRQPIGSPIITTLTARVKAVERLVGLLDALSKVQNSIKCKTTTLRNVTFTYGERFDMSVGLTDEKITISLEDGNPHIRVIGFLETLVNSPLGFRGLVSWLPTTLPILATLDSIEDQWKQLAMNDQGSVEVFPHTLDWLGVRYRLGGSNEAKERRLDLGIKLRSKEGQLWWHVYRSPPPSRGKNQPDDEFTPVLKPIWNGRADGWRGLTTGGTAPPDKIGQLLTHIDGKIREMVAGPAPARGGGAGRPGS